MSTFIMTPTYDVIDAIVRNPVTSTWTLPLLTFNTSIRNPLYGYRDPLNEDPSYQNKVVKNFYLRLTEKWLYKDRAFRKLLQYFKVDEANGEGKVGLITDSKAKVDDVLQKKYKKYIFSYIEKLFISKSFVRRVLTDYITKTGAKWYDLFNNTGTVKKLLAHKLRRKIAKTMYKLQDYVPSNKI